MAKQSRVKSSYDKLENRRWETHREFESHRARQSGASQAMTPKQMLAWRLFGSFGAHCVCPAIRCFVEANPLKSQVIAVGVAVNRVQAVESDTRQILGSRHLIKDDGLVIRQRVQKIDDGAVAGKGQKGVIPFVDQVCLGQILDQGKIHDHTVGAVAGLVDDVSGKRYFDDVAVAMQVPALAAVVGDAVARVEFEAAGDQHGGIVFCAAADYTMTGC